MLIVWLLVALPLNTLADPLLPLPTGDRVNVGTETSPDLRQCFSLEDMKKIVTIYYVGYIPCAEEKQLLQDRLVLAEDEINHLGQIIVVQQESLVKLATENERIFDKWKEENRLRHIAEQKGWTDHLGWAAAATFGISTAILTGIIIIRD